MYYTDATDLSVSLICNLFCVASAQRGALFKIEIIKLWYDKSYNHKMAILSYSRIFECYKKSYNHKTSCFTILGLLCHFLVFISPFYEKFCHFLVFFLRFTRTFAVFSYFILRPWNASICHFTISRQNGRFTILQLSIILCKAATHYQNTLLMFWLTLSNELGSLNLPSPAPFWESIWLHPSFGSIWMQPSLL